jgi:hypothetical protein
MKADEMTVLRTLAFAFGSSLVVAGCWHEDRNIDDARRNDRRDRVNHQGLQPPQPGRATRWSDDYGDPRR